MDRVHGATESCAFVRQLDFVPGNAAFDAAFSKKKQAIRNQSANWGDCPKVNRDVP
jgi:hypothetical protein